MASVPSYLLLSRHSIYYFRVVVPDVLRPLIRQHEIRRSLQTRCRREALIRGRELLVQVQRLFTEAFQGQRPCLDRLLGSWESSGKRVASWASWLHQQQMVSVASAGIPVSPASDGCRSEAGAMPLFFADRTVDSPLFSVVVDEHLRLQEREGVLAKTVDDKRAVAGLLIRIVGDLPIKAYTRKDAHSFRDIALRLPPRLFYYPDNKSLEAIIESATSTITVTTYNKYVKNLTTFFSYAIREGYCDRNPFDGIQVRQRGRASDERSIFTNDDLKKIFNAATYPSADGKKPYRFWLPLLGLYTGARLSELSQLYIDDVVTVSGITCLHIRAGREDQRLKTPSSERLIPIHSKLRELGFLDFVKRTGEQGHERIFPEFSWHNRHGYGAIPSKWFARLRADLGFRDGAAKKDFHSFRHTLADHLKQKGVAESLVGGILGHQTGGITFGRYGKDFRPEVLAAVIEQVDLASF